VILTPRSTEVHTIRTKQLAYSTLQPMMRDEESRRAKGRKIVAILEHFLGASLSARRVLDLGSSTGFISEELALGGAEVVGVDIDWPGLTAATSRSSRGVALACAAGERLPFRDECVDVVVFNHIYEHALDPVALMDEMLRVVRPEGVLFLGLGNRLGVVEPHYRLPFLSYLRPRWADRYVRLYRRGDHYHERFRTRRGLRRLVGGLMVWDYTLTVIAHPECFAAGDMVRGWRARVPHWVLRLKPARSVIPTYLWVASRTPRAPAGPRLDVAPSPVRTPDSRS
jgi:SAM-dependent methyltransferase